MREHVEELIKLKEWVDERFVCYKDEIENGSVDVPVIDKKIKLSFRALDADGNDVENQRIIQCFEEEDEVYTISRDGLPNFVLIDEFATFARWNFDRGEYRKVAVTNTTSDGKAKEVTVVKFMQ